LENLFTASVHVNLADFLRSCMMGWVCSASLGRKREMPVRRPMRLMSAYFCPHLMFNFGYLIEFMCLKSDLIDNSDN